MFGTLVIRKWVGGAERNCQEVTKIDLRQPAQAKIRYTISLFFPSPSQIAKCRILLGGRTHKHTAETNAGVG